MMKTYRYITYLMLLFAVFAFAACDDDESGQPVIERVRLTDPDYKTGSPSPQKSIFIHFRLYLLAQGSQAVF